MYNAYYLLLTPVGKNISPMKLSNISWLPIIGILVCYYLNALVVVWSNKSLHKWLLGKYVNLTSSSSSGSSTPQNASSNEKDKSFLTNNNVEINNNVEMNNKIQDEAV